MATAEPEGAKQELESLHTYRVVYSGDKTKAFIEWAREHADRLYPEVGQRNYVVPPIFVHKHSMRYNPSAGADVLQETQKSSPKGEKAHSLVMRSFHLLGPRLPRPLFVISGLEYDNMLKWVRHHTDLSPALPDAVENRGDIDIMLIHPLQSVIFIQVKAVGDNAESRTPGEIVKKIVLGGKQLRKDENILRWVLHDWPDASTCHVTHVVALPNLTRDEVAALWPPADLDPSSEEAESMNGVLFLCKDDLPESMDPATAEADTDVTSLMTWWNKHVANVKADLSLPFMKDIVSRYVGMLSAVEVYAGNNLRKEVRVTPDAVDVCGMMFRRILLNEQQLKILLEPCQRRYLSGPPGCGKTVLLVLRARQFVRQGGYVIVVNMYRGAAGRAIGHFIREGVARFRVPDSKKSKPKSKGKKKKGEERQTEQATPPTPRKTNENKPPGPELNTPPQTRRRTNTPPTPCKKAGTQPTAARANRDGTPTPPPKQGASPRVKKKPSSALSENKQGPVAPTPTRPNASPPRPSTPNKPQTPCTPPASRKAQEVEIDASDRVKSVDVDIDAQAFNSADFESSVRRCLPASGLNPENLMFIVDEIYVKDYWSSLLDVLETFEGCHIWCAGLYSRNPPGFDQEDLSDVLRCPPMVQKVLYAVDWDENRKKCYRLDTDRSGVYTPGLTPLSVRHQGHPQVSITECQLCADQLSSLLHDGLGLEPAVSRSTASLQCSDVVLLVNIPRRLYEPDSQGYLDTTRDDFSRYMAYLSTCPLVAALQRAKVPVEVIQELPCWSLYDPEARRGKVAMAWAYAYQGLENKVVIYVPGDSPWTPVVHEREIPAPGLCSASREQPKDWEPVTAASLPTPNPEVSPVPLADLGTTEQKVLYRCERAACCEGMKAPSEARTGNDAAALEPEKSGIREGGAAEATADTEDAGSKPPGAESGCSGSGSQCSGSRSNCSRSESQCTSVNLAEFWWRKEDVERYSTWDKSNVFVAGSRCLSQLVMLIP